MEGGQLSNGTADGFAGELNPQGAGQQEQAMVPFAGGNQQCPQSQIQNRRAKIQVASPRSHPDPRSPRHVVKVNEKRNSSEQDRAQDEPHAQRAPGGELGGGSINQIQYDDENQNLRDRLVQPVDENL